MATLIKFITAAFLVGMAYWSHSNAKRPADPGFLKWEDFRSEEELKDKDDQRKWSDPNYSE